MRHLSVDLSGAKRLFYLIELGRNIRFLSLLQELLGPHQSLDEFHVGKWRRLGAWMEVARKIRSENFKCLLLRKSCRS